ncbi:hypothetical protein BGZ94_008688 [Podila epigama]|nr:hypothetical protein BGZ94_008688 [Podila epigama]
MASRIQDTAAYAAHRATRAPSRSLTGFVTLKDGLENSSTQVNIFIKLYIYTTLAAVVGYLFLDVGKIWAVVGALHNLLEVALLIVLHSGGRVTSMSFGIYMFIYVCVTIICSVYFSWPLDAIFFRWQGLCSDFGLIVMFTRIYLATKKQLAQFDGGRDEHDAILAHDQLRADRLQAANASAAAATQVPIDSATSESAPSTFHQLHTGLKKLVARAPVLSHHLQSSDSSSDSEDEHAPSTGRTASRWNRQDQTTHSTLTPESTHDAQFTTVHISSQSNGTPAATTTTMTAGAPLPSHGHGSGHIVTLNQDAGIWGVQWQNPDQILLLIAASVAHVLGNCVTTIWTLSTVAMAAFHISYGVSYPLYAYYLYVDNHALRQTKIYLPEFTKIKTATFAIVAIIGSTATIRAGLFVATQAKKGELL